MAALSLTFADLGRRVWRAIPCRCKVFSHYPSDCTPVTVIPPPHTWSMVTVPVDERSGDELHRSLLEAHVAMRSAQRCLFADIAEHDRRGAWRGSGSVCEEGF